LDDQGKISTIKRFGAQVLAAAWAVFWLGGLRGIRFGSMDVHVGLFGSLLAMLCIVWFINLYNFMDGIDGLAAINAVTVGLVAAILLLFGGDQSLYLLVIPVAGAAAGFLLWNWAPAKIFMGDVGSGFLGFVFATLAIASDNAGRLPILTWILLLGVFVVDATITLLRRVVRGETWYAAHRSHAYQRIVRAGHPHARVSTAVAMVNFVLGAIMFVTLVSPRSTLALEAAALAGLVTLYFLVEKIQPM
jgi:UDP-N-acetylmuramyl pentapeptide phosphotransferase/UDP-N-acetylglucosamine-1-phosphate transferase